VCFCRQMAGVVTNKDLCFLGKWPAWSPTKTMSVFLCVGVGVGVGVGVSVFLCGRKCGGGCGVCVCGGWGVDADAGRVQEQIQV